MRKLFLATALLAFATPALADGAATAQPAALTQPASANPQNQIVCRFMTHEGMVLRKPLCMTRASWELASYKARQQLADFQKRRYSH